MSEWRCPICAGTRWLPVSQTPPLVACAGCRLHRLDPMPSAETLTHQYVEADASAGRGTGADHQSLPPRWKARVLTGLARATAQPGVKGFLTRVVLHPFAAHFRGLPSRHRHGRMIDVGSGTGLTLEILQQIGWEVNGIELDPRAAAARPGLPIFVGDLSTIKIPEGQADVVRAWHVVEHLRNPLEALQRMRGWLVPGGELILGVPNIDSAMRWWFRERWAGWRSPYHLYHFTSETIRALVARAGFSKVRVRCASVGTVLDNLEVTANPVARGISIYLDLGFDLCGLGDGLEVRATR